MTTMTLSNGVRISPKVAPKKAVILNKPELKTNTSDIIIVAGVGLLVLGIMIAGIIAVGTGHASFGQPNYIYGF